MRASLRSLWLLLGVFFSVWSLWCVVLVHYRAVLDADTPTGALYRMAVRLVVWLGLVFAYRLRVERSPDLGLRPFDGRSALAGLLVALLWIVPGSLLALRSGAHLRLPTSFIQWASPALSAPFAEELLFRGVVLRVLAEAWPRWRALVVSSALFGASHLPYWLISGVHVGADLLVWLGKIALLGAGFGLVYLWRRSVWAALFAHWANNIASTLIA